MVLNNNVSCGIYGIIIHRELKLLEIIIRKGGFAIELVSYILWIIAAPAALAFLGVNILKKRAWLIVSIEVIAVLFLTFIGIIENNPMGNMQRQLSSYFGKITNDFYLKYLPLIIMTMIFIRFFRKTNKMTN